MDGFALNSTGPEKPGDVWLTPRYIIDALGPFDLDPCAAIARPWNCATLNWVWTVDGLAHDWLDRFVWMNPPYSSVTIWMGAIARHGNGIALVFARTDTSWFHESVWGIPCSLIFLRSRIAFLDADGNKSPHGSASSASVLVGYGDKARSRLEGCGLGGHLIRNEGKRGE